MKQRLFCSIHAAIALFLGAASYVVLRDSTHLHKLLSFVVTMRHAVSPVGLFVGGYLPDFLWGYSLAMALYAACLPTRRYAYVPAMLSVVCGFLWELLQRLAVVSGTGDIADCVLYILAAIVSNIIYQKRMRK